MPNPAALKRKVIAAALLPLVLRMRRRSAYQALFADAVRMQLGWILPEVFRQQLDRFYATVDRPRLLDDIEFEEKKRSLAKPQAYKVGIQRLKGDRTPGSLAYRLSPWSRRFGLLARLGIRSDIIILRAGEQIPPHGHERVVSGFYVAEGQVHLRHYHLDRIEGDTVYLRKAIDQICEEGGYGTNSDEFQNVHWLAGLAPRSFLLRFTVTGVPTSRGQSNPTRDRVYVDPTGVTDEFGVIRGRLVSEADAHALRMTS